MPGFDPDAYLAKKSGGFDPDAYLANKGAAPSAEKPKEEEATGIRARVQELRGLGEAGLNAVTGMIAKPVSDIAGMGAMAYDTLSGRNEGNAGGFKDYVQKSMTYEPRTQWGKNIAEYNPMALIGKGTDYLGSNAEQIIAPPGASTGRQMVGAGVHEAVNQAPALLGLKSPPILEAAGDMAKAGARRTMNSALKPTIAAHRTGKAAKAVDTMLDEGINVSPGGVAKIRDRIGDLNNQIADQIKNSTAIIDKQTVMANMQGLLDKFSKQVNPLNDMAAIQKAFDEFDLTVQDHIPVQEAQTLKQGTYKQLGDKSYGELKSADIEAQKSIARGLKEQIANMVPEVRPLNAKESNLLNALSVSERRVMMEANKNPFGLSWLTTNPIKFAGFMADRSAMFKSLVARMLNTTAEGLQSSSASGAPVAKAGGVSTTGYADQEKERRYQEWLKKQDE